MKTIPYFKAGVVATAICASSLFFWLDDYVPATSKVASSSAIEQASPVLPVSPLATLPAAKTSLPGTSRTDKGLDFDPKMKLKLQSISEAYQEQIRFPSNSLPIKPGELSSKYLPDIAIANELPAKLSDPESPMLSIKTNQLRYFAGDKVTARASISGLEESENSAVSATLTANNEVIAHATVLPIRDQAHSFELVFSALVLDNPGPRLKMTLEAEFQFLGRRYHRGSSIEYLTTIASVEDVAPGYVEGEYLTIPVYVSTQKTGFHRLQANLYDAQNGSPLVHLRAEDNLDLESGTLYLKAHIAALKEAGSEGPYELKDLSLQRLPTAPDYISEFGKIDQEAFSLPGFSFSEYVDKPYINEKAQRIAKELRRLGS